MSDTNRLELDIVALDDTGPGTTRAKANFKSMEQQAGASASNMTKVFDAYGVEFQRSFDRASASVLRQIQTLENRAALVGKTGVDRIRAQGEILKRAAGEDEAARARVSAAIDTQSKAYERQDAIRRRLAERRAAERATVEAGTLAGQAVLPGEAAFAAALKQNQDNAALAAKLSRANILATETTAARTTREEAEALSGRGITPTQRADIQSAFAARRVREQQAEQAAIDATAAKGLNSHNARVAQLEKEAALFGKTGSARATALRDIEIAELRAAGAGAKAIEARLAGFALLIAAAKKAEEAESAGGGNPRRLILALKDALAGYQRGATLEVTDYFIGTGGQGGALRGPLSSIGALTGASKFAAIAVGGLAAGFIALEFAGFEAVKSLGQYGEAVENIHLRTGLAVTEVEAFTFAAKRGGADVSIFERMMRGLSQAEDETSKRGTGARTELEKLGVSLRDSATGDIRPTSAVLLDVAKALNELPAGFQRDAAALQLFQRIGIEAIPVISRLIESLQTARDIHLGDSQQDIVDFAKYKKDIDEAEALWTHFKHEVEGKIAPVVIVTLKFIKSFGGSAGSVAGVGGAAEGIVGMSEYIADQFPKSVPIPVGTGDVAKANAEYAYNARVKNRHDTDEKILAFRKQQELDPAFRLREAEEELRAASAAGDKLNVASPEQFRAYKEAYEKVEELKASMKKKPKETLDKSFGQDILDAQREYNSTELELARKQREGTFKTVEDEEKRKVEALHSLYTEGDKLDTDARNRYFQRQVTDNDRDKNLALSQLEFIDAQSKREKIALEDEKLAIEKAYAERSLQIQIQKIQSDKGVELAKLEQKRNIVNSPEGEAAFQENKAKLEYSSNVEIDEARKATAEKELTQAQDIANKKTQLAISEDRKIFDSLKQSANGLFDALFEKSKSFADVLKGLFKTAILTPIKDIFSSQVAGLFTELLTGQKVTFNEVGTGQGRFGKLGAILGRAGLGTPRFGQPGDHLSNLNLPNHLGDAQLVSGAVPVVIVNGGSQSLAIEASGGGVQGLARSLVALPQILGSVAGGSKALSAAVGVAPVALKRLQESVGSAISYSNGAVDALSSSSDQFVSDYLAGQLPSAPPYQTADKVGYDALDNYNARELGSDGSPGSEGVPVGAGSSVPGGGGFFSHIAGLFGGGGGGGLFGKGGLAGFFGKGTGTTGLPDTSGPVPGQNLPGAPPIGGLAGLQGSAAASLGAAIGFGLVLDGLKRKSGVASAIEMPLGAAAIGFKLGGAGGAFVGAGAGLLADGLKRGGVTGIFEDAGGGALIGAKFGGPVGAVIGAAVGAGAGLIRKFFFETEREHTKKLVKQIYGLKINDSTADAIIQIAKQKYGGAISIAVRSQEVRDLLKLYAETLGDKKGQAQFVADKVHSASLVESNGKLYQQAVYDNGQAYAYSSPLSTYGGVNTSPLPTASRDSGAININGLQLSLNGQSASDALAGQVVGVATPGFVQGRVLSASNASNGRLNQTALTLSPSAITR